jgi:hypothetical protein
MATNGSNSTGNNLDSIITVKVSFENVTRRVKMPLRDTTPTLLEKQLRAFLHIPIDWQITIERFSDSAGDYIALEPANIAAYKQLYRAAKAKSKLKLRVSRKEVAAGAVSDPVLTIKSAPNGAAVEPALDGPRFAICCNNCDATMTDIHYHCSTCEDGDFDLCQDCVDKGVACNSGEHWLIKRTTNKNGQVITSTTQTVTPGEKTKVSWDPVTQSMSKLSIGGRTCNGCVQGTSIPAHSLSSYLPLQHPLVIRFLTLRLFFQSSLPPSSFTARSARTSISATAASPRMSTATTPSMALSPPFSEPRFLSTSRRRPTLVAT